MKKNVLNIAIFIVFILIISSIIIVINIGNIKKNSLEVQTFNSSYEEYNREGLNGLDVTTVINKATSNNDKNYIEKDSNGYYKDDDDRVEVFVTFNGNSYQMERINKLGIESFIEYFASVQFNCTDVKYHTSGKIASMTFEAVNY